MVTLRFTKSLLVRLHLKPVTDEVEPTGRLRDWYATLLHRPGGQVMLFVNERSLLSVVILASPASTLVPRFVDAAADVLRLLGVPSAVIEAGRREMADVRVGKTVSRQVLGSMNDFAYLMDTFREDPISLSDIAVKLAQAPCSPIGMKRPRDVALEMLAGRA